MPARRPPNDLELIRHCGHGSAIARIRDNWELCQQICYQYGLSARGLSVVLYLLECPSHGVRVSHIQEKFGNAAQALGASSYNRVFVRETEHLGGRGKRITWLTLRPEVREAIESALSELNQAG